MQLDVEDQPGRPFALAHANKYALKRRIVAQGEAHTAGHCSGDPSKRLKLSQVHA